MLPHHILLTIFATTYFAVASLAQVLIPRNVTLDDNDPRVIYSGGWMNTPPHPFNFQGGHKLGYTAESVARITFSGTELYFLSSLWPYKVTTQVVLDGGFPEVLDLQDHAYMGPGQDTESAIWRVVKSWNGLNPETPHTLEVSIVPGENFAVFDAVIFTELIPSTPPIPTPDPIPTYPLPSATGPVFDPSDTIPLPTSTTSTGPQETTDSVRPASPSQASSIPKTRIIIACAVSLCIILLIGYLCYRRGRRDGKRRKRNSNLHSKFEPSASQQGLRDTVFSALSADIEIGQPHIATKGVFQPASVMWYKSIAPRLSRTFTRRRPSQANTSEHPDTAPPTRLPQARPSYHRRRDYGSGIPPVPPLPEIIPFPTTSNLPSFSQLHTSRYPPMKPNPQPETRKIRLSAQPARPTKVEPTPLVLAKTRSFSAQSISGTTMYGGDDYYGGIAQSIYHDQESSTMATRASSMKKPRYSPNQYSEPSTSKSEKGRLKLVELSYGSPPPPAYAYGLY